MVFIHISENNFHVVTLIRTDAPYVMLQVAETCSWSANQSASPGGDPRRRRRRLSSAVSELDKSRYISSKAARVKFENL